ncbi:hypothetical protein pb186bvf_020855 [Paramecium bursaria]
MKLEQENIKQENIKQEKMVKQEKQEFTVPSVKMNVIYNSGQMTTMFVKQFLFDVIVPGQTMFVDDKLQTFKNQIQFYKNRLAKCIPQKDAFIKFLEHTRNPVFGKQYRMIILSLLGDQIEIQQAMEAEIGKISSQVEAFEGTIAQQSYKDVYDVNWRIQKHKIYIGSIFDIVRRMLTLIHLLAQFLSSVFRQKNIILNLNMDVLYQDTYIKIINPNVSLEGNMSIRLNFKKLL